MRLQAFDLHVAYQTGKYLHIAGTLSRAYFQEQTEQLFQEEIEVNLLSAHIPISEKTKSVEKLKLLRTVNCNW